MIIFSKYEKKYPGGSGLVISIPELTLNNGIYWLKGENGSGKTTLLKSIAGLIPYKGVISVNDIRSNEHKMTFRKIVAYAEAEPVYPGFLTGRDIIHFYSNTKGPGSFTPGRLSEMLGTESYLDQKTATYSAGMLKKLSLLLAFIGTPALIMLDEPLITLDKNSVTAIQALILQYYESGCLFSLLPTRISALIRHSI